MEELLKVQMWKLNSTLVVKNMMQTSLKFQEYQLPIAWKRISIAVTEYKSNVR